MRDITERQDLGLHITYVSERANKTVPSIGLAVGEPRSPVRLFALEQEGAHTQPEGDQEYACEYAHYGQSSLVIV